MADEPYENVLVHLQVRKRKGDRAECLCPAHDDHSASLSVAKGTDVPVVLHCHAGCNPDAVMQAIGMDLADLMGGRPHRVQAYPYVDATGNVLYWVERWVPKTFRPRLPDGTYARPKPADEVLFNLPSVLWAKANGKPVYLVEGERDVETAREFGHVATTAMSGASQPWLPQFSEMLAGTELVIVADNDNAGRARARRLVEELSLVTLSCRAAVPRHGKDLSDHLWAGYNLNLLDPLPSEGTLARYSLTHVAASPMTWAWDGWLPAAMLSLIEGDPGEGKSVLTCDLAARWTTGAPMPDGTPNPFGGPVRVGMVTAEDDPARVIKPRFAVAGGNFDRLVYVAGMPMVGTKYLRNVDLERDVEALREAIEAEQLRVLILDPLMAFLGSTKTAIDSEVRKVLTPLRYLAEETDCAIIAVRHLRKQGGKAVHAGGGSIAFTGQARSVLLVGRNPHEAEQRVLAVTKVNVGAPPASLAYRVVPDNFGFIVAPRVAWDGEIAINATDLMAAEAMGSSTVRGEVTAEVVQLLTIEDLEFKTLHRRVLLNGCECSEKLLHDVLRVVAGKVRLNTGTTAQKVVYRLKSKPGGNVPPTDDAETADHTDPNSDNAVNPKVDSRNADRTPPADTSGLTDSPDVSPEDSKHQGETANPKVPEPGAQPAFRLPTSDLTDPPGESEVKADEWTVACHICGATKDILYFEVDSTWRCQAHVDFPRGGK